GTSATIAAGNRPLRHSPPGAARATLSHAGPLGKHSATREIFEAAEGRCRIGDKQFPRISRRRTDQALDVEVHFLGADHPTTDLGEPTLPPMDSSVAVSLSTASTLPACFGRTKRAI